MHTLIVTFLMHEASLLPPAATPGSGGVAAAALLDVDGHWLRLVLVQMLSCLLW
jgi:hypothetical protein